MHPLLTIEHLSKVFPGQVALDDVSLSIGTGQTHALVGQNGSGKSTLIKILAGYHQPTGDPTATFHHDDGTHALTLGDGTDAHRCGIRFVHQDLGLVGGLSAVENIALGNGFATKFGRIDWRGETKRATTSLASLGFDDFSVSIPVAGLAPSQRTAVALARALHGWERGATLLVLDEPTASLPGADVARLFDAVRRLQERGVAILYVSHHLDEVFEIADEVTVLRDGRNITTAPVDTLDHDRLIELMIGHRIERGRSAAGADLGGDLLSVRGVCGGSVHRFDVIVPAREVVGVAGITGSGREMVVPLVTGQVPTEDGEVSVGGVDLPPYQPSIALQNGMAFVAADRFAQGIFATLPVTDNMTVSNLCRNTQGWRIVRKREAVEVGEWIDRLDIKTASARTPIGALSGGNQQKVLFARGLRLDPSVIVLDEPTRGVDVGAKEQIHQLIDDAAARGAAVLVASTDSDELVRLAHRVIVMRNGVVGATLVGDQISVENIERAQLANAGANQGTDTAS